VEVGPGEELSPGGLEPGDPALGDAPVGARLSLGAAVGFSLGEVDRVESGEYRPASAVIVEADDQPPTMRTDPSARSVAVCPDRASAIVPIGSKTSFTGR